jgi:Meckel syndrome type 1 protein
MKQHPAMLRPATVALFASVALFNAPVLAQTPAPPPVVVSPPPPTAAPPPAPVVNLAPPPVRAAPPAARPRLDVTLPPPEEAAPTRRAAAPVSGRSARARHVAPIRAPVSAPPPARAEAPVAAPPPVAQEPTVPPPPAAAPAPVPVERPAAAPRQPAVAQRVNPLWYWLIGLVALAVIAFFAFRRRRPEEVYDEPRHDAPIEPAAPASGAAPFIADPVIAAEPVPVASAAAVAAEAVADRGNVSLAAPDARDIEALASTSEPVAGRPWIELLLRPIRAGTSRVDAIVQFELTVGNTGSVPARDVRISTWMMAGDASDMERSLIAPPPDARVSELDIPAGDGTRIEAEIAMPKAGLGDAVLPIVAAEARYRLPDGREGRTAASFAIGRADEDGLHPFPTDRASGLIESVGAELHGEPERV